MSTLTAPSMFHQPMKGPAALTSVEQYHAMIQAGAFAKNESVELLEGRLVPKMPKNPPHTISTRRTLRLISEILPPQWEADSQEPITTDDSEPEPDVSVVRAGARDHLGRHPIPTEIGKVVEVSDTTLVRDRGVKKVVYARAAIAIYWIINLVDRCIEVYTDPTGPMEKPDYRTCRIYVENETIPVTLDGVELGTLEARQLLP